MEEIIFTFGILIFGLFKAISYITENYDETIANVLNKLIFGSILSIMPILLIILIEFIKIKEEGKFISLITKINPFVNVFVFIIIGFFMFNVYQIVESIKKLYYKGKYD